MNVPTIPHRTLAMASIVLVLVAASSISVAAATVKEQPVTLTGCLDTGGLADQGERSFTLIEQESGDWVPVEGPAELKDHLGQLVSLTGTWVYDQPDVRYFAADSVTLVADSCQGHE